MSLRKIILALFVVFVVAAPAFLLHLNGVDMETILKIYQWEANGATVLALFFVGLELRNSTRSHHLEGAMRIFDIFDTPEARKGRRAIYSASRDGRELKKNEIEYAEKIRADINQMGIMVKKGLFPKEIALEMYSTMAIRCWKALSKYIEEQRNDRGNPYFMEYFEWFYNESKQYRKKKDPEGKLKTFKQT